ncbi:MAG TPA: ABC transporter ATP-binding protein [Solirubrobacterales bacterium]|nr:ABC transporter ATP-binding protein [Solirubrobacterales bacterium]
MSGETISLDRTGSDDGGVAERRAERIAAAPVVLEARDVHKTFHIPDQKIQSFKERAVHPFRRQHFRELRALNGISLEIRKGEFFGIVGRNGSGKSTLLKILASIYAADSGRIRMAGTMAPFIELGVGFNPDVTARENVILNGVMMGLTPDQARERLDAVFAFAELENFKELQLKNYSSGMVVRLAFAVMVQADTDILLIDEVLAVGDASFQQKCADVFHGMRDSGKTVVLVTHDMAAVETYCDRAMMIHDGDVIAEGDPDEVARSYYRINFEEAAANPEAVAMSEDALNAADASIDAHTELVEAELLDEAGDPISNVEQGSPLRFRALLEAREELRNPVFSFLCSSRNGTHVFGFRRTLTHDEDEFTVVAPGQRVELNGTVANPLAPGKYVLSCWISRDAERGEVAFQAVGLAAFMVYGGGQPLGLVEVEAEVEAHTIEGDRA